MKNEQEDQEEKVTELWGAQREELGRLVAKHGSTITPAQILSFAKRPTTALHQVFEWDDTAAAHAYRLTQAEQFLRCQFTVLPGPDQTPIRVRAFVSIPSERGTGVYRPMVDVLQREDYVRELDAEYGRELRNLQLRRRALAKLSPLYQLVEEVLEATLT